MNNKVNWILSNVNSTNSFRQIAILDSISTDDTIFKKEFEKNVNDSTLASTQLGVVNRYLFTSSQLGWINCDRFYQKNTPRIDYVVGVGESSDTYVSLVFHSMRAILDGYSQTGKNCKFNNVPTGEKVTIVAMKKVDNKTFLAIKESVTASKIETNLTFEPVTMAKLKSEMQKLNSLN